MVFDPFTWSGALGLLAAGALTGIGKEVGKDVYRWIRDNPEEAKRIARMVANPSDPPEEIVLAVALWLIRNRMV